MTANKIYTQQTLFNRILIFNTKYMEVHFLGKLPDNYSAYGKLDEFDEYDMEELNSFGFDEVWYWYSTAPYEGSGQILMRKGELYDLHDAGNCSCYGPIDRLKFKGEPLKEIA